MKLVWSKSISYLYLGAGNLKSRLSSLLYVRPFLIAAIAALALNLLSWLFAAIIQRSIGSGLAVLHYNVIFGVDLIGDATRIYVLPLLGMGLYIVNFLLAATLGSKQERFVSYLLIGAAGIGNIIILAAVYFVYIVNFS